MQQFRSIIWNSFHSSSKEGLINEYEFLHKHLLKDGMIFYFLPASDLQLCIKTLQVRHWAVRDSVVYNPLCMVILSMADFVPTFPTLIKYDKNDNVKFYERLISISTQSRGDIACSEDLSKDVHIAALKSFVKAYVIQPTRG